jgi:integrase
VRIRKSSYKHKQTGKWKAQVRVIWDDGTETALHRMARSKAAANALADKIAAEIEATGGRVIAYAAALFLAFAAYYAETYLIPAKIIDGQKVEGLRTWKDMQGKLAVLVAHFGDMPLKEIRYGHLRAYKSKRLGTPTKGGGQRAVSSVNRELSLLQRMFNVAVREGWISKNPFTEGDPLAMASLEQKRTRVLSLPEESRLLKACEAKERLHLRGILIFLLDTGCRFGEMKSLTWSGVDLDRRIITIEAKNTKTLTPRQVPITKRLDEVLRERRLLGGKPEDLVFGIRSNVKTSFNTAKRLAGITELTLHDLRHTAASRISQGGAGIETVAIVLGHTQLKTTLRYINRTPELLAKVTGILEGVQESANATEGTVN